MGLRRDLAGRDERPRFRSRSAGALALATERATIGTAIVPVYNRTPAVLAMSAGTLAELSDDRFVLGLGSSSHAIVEGWNGVAFERPLAHVREKPCDRASGAREARRPTTEGEAFRSKGFRLGPARGKPVPIYVAALREKMLRLAGEIGDGLIVNLFPVTALPRILAAWRAGAARRAATRRGQEVVCRFQVCVTDDVAGARGLVRAAFGGYVATPVYNASSPGAASRTWRTPWPRPSRAATAPASRRR